MRKLQQQLVSLLIFIAPVMQLQAQLVKEEFHQSVFNDNFDEDKGNFKSISNSDNLFVIQDGEYLLKRKSTFNGYSVFTSWKNTLPAYSLISSLKLEDAKVPDASIGLIFMAQEDGSGAFVFEFNQLGQYRLKQLVGVNYKLLTGEVKTGGWMVSALIKPLFDYNMVEIKTSKKNYDIYVNQKFLLSFTELAYKTGNIGIAIGPGTKARVDYLSVSGPKDESIKPVTPVKDTTSITTTTITTKTKPVKYDPGQSSTSDVILKLVEQVSKLSVENQMLKDTIINLRKQMQNTPVETPNPKKTTEQKPVDKKVSEIKPSDKKSAEQKTAPQKTSEEKTVDKKIPEVKANSQKPADEKPVVKKSDEAKPAEKKSTDSKATIKKTSDEKKK